MTTKNLPAPNPTALQQLRAEWRQDPEYHAALEEARADLDVAGIIYEARKAAGLTQKELAERVGTSPSAISRLEDADYEGHSLAMLRRVAAALGKRVVIQFAEAEAAEAAEEAAPEALAAA